MSDIKIGLNTSNDEYVEMSLEEALNEMIDEWVEVGNNCQQTTLDLRDACRKILSSLSSLEAELKSANEAIDFLVKFDCEDDSGVTCFDCGMREVCKVSLHRRKFPKKDG